MLDNVNQPVIVCGCHGGGTSYVMKLLRWSGLYAGADTVQPNARKNHESRSYTWANETILQTLTGGCTFGMRTTDPAEWKLFFEKLKDPEAFARAFGVINRARLRRRYWGGKKQIGWFFHRFARRHQRWGWKDPRNSLTLPFWLRIYPQPKVLVVTKAWCPGRGRSRSGSWFKEESTQTVRDIYMHPPALRTHRVDTFFIDFSELTHPARMADLFDWVGLQHLEESELERLLGATQLEQPVEPS